VLKAHDAVDERVQRVVGAHPDVCARMPLGAALAQNDVPGDDAFAAVLLHAAEFRVAVSAVARRADAFLMSHSEPRSAELDVVDLHFGEALPMTALARVVLSPLVLEHDDLWIASVPYDLARHARATEHGRTRLNRVAIGSEQHFVELDVGTFVAFERRNLVGAARLDAELLAAGSNDRVRHDGALDLWSEESVKLDRRVSCVNASRLKG